jgi:hypothetical protein
MTIEELKNKKLMFEKQIANLMFKFERDNNIEISEIKVEKHGFLRGDRISTVSVTIEL